MSELIVADVEKGKFQSGDLKDVTFLYVVMNEPKNKFENDKEKEYSVKCVVDEATAEVWKKKFKKNTPDEVKTEDFKDTHGIDAPYPDQDTQYILLVKVAAQDKDGVPYTMSDFKRPKLYTPSSNGVKDITTTTLVANGSKGDVYFWVSNNKYGSFPMLNEVLVRELIVYEGRAAGSSRWGVVEQAVEQDAPAENKEAEPELLEEDDDFA